MRPVHCPLHLLKAIIMGRAFIQDHYDIGAEGLLEFNDQLGSEQVLTAINMRAKHDPIVVYLAEPSQTEYLKATAIGEHSAIPTHKVMQTTHLLNHGYARSEVKVVGIGQYH